MAQGSAPPLHRGLGLVSGPQFCVRLARRPSRREPDVLFVAAARRNLVRPNHVEGPPDLVLEVVSPESQSRDRREKYIEYEAAGIPEYWIADPLSRMVEAYTLLDGRYTPIPEGEGRIASIVVPAGTCGRHGCGVSRARACSTRWPS